MGLDANDDGCTIIISTFKVDPAKRLALVLFSPQLVAAASSRGIGAW